MSVEKAIELPVKEPIQTGKYVWQISEGDRTHLCTAMTQLKADQIVQALNAQQAEKQPEPTELSKDLKKAFMELIKHTRSWNGNDTRLLILAKVRINRQAARIEELEKIHEILQPILDWYGGGTEGNRSDVEILHDVISDLQSDRAEVLRLQKGIKELEIRGAKSG